MLCVYMRPWCLDPEFASATNPLLSDLGKLAETDNNRRMCSGGNYSQSTPESALTPKKRKRGKQQPDSHALLASTQHASTNTSPTSALRAGTTAKTSPTSELRASTTSGESRRSYAASWEFYVRGNVISNLSARYIKNMLAATAASKGEEQGDSSTDSDAEDWANAPKAAGNLDLVKKTLQGIGAQSRDDGTRGFGRHAKTITLGRILWESQPLSPEQAKTVKETCFDDGRFPSAEEIKTSLKALSKEAEEKIAPYAGLTSPYAKYTEKDFSTRLDTWFQTLNAEKEKPTAEQLAILEDIANRIRSELVLQKIGDHVQTTINRMLPEAEPLRGFIHGEPGTGKSRLIKWVRRLFTEAMEWDHGVQFIFIAVQNRVAYAMGGTTFHTGGEVPVGDSIYRRLDHCDVDVLFTRNQLLRFVLIDEVGMTPDTLLGTFEHNLTDAAVKNLYSTRPDKTLRPFGGYNTLVLGDLYQIPPIPSSAALFIPPTGKKTEVANKALYFLWGNEGDFEDSINYFKELTVQKRTSDHWYNSCLQACRMGNLPEEDYNFLQGLPTEHCGTWGSEKVCTSCTPLTAVWRQMILSGSTWEDLQKLECPTCSEERSRRNRLLAPNDARVREAPFVSAPYIHKNNQPKYHATLLRAAEDAKMRRKYILWFPATDEPENPAQVSKTPAKLQQRLETFLQFHEQKTSGIPGLNIIYQTMPARVTEKIVKGKIKILKHTPCKIWGWDLHTLDRRQGQGTERFLCRQPAVIYLHFDNVDWTVDTRLGKGIFPLFPVHRTWTLNEKTGAKVKRFGYTMIPDFAWTAFMAQGMNLQAGLADCGDILDAPGLTEQMNTYVILSRFEHASGLLLLRAFAPELFTNGEPPGHIYNMDVYKSDEAYI